MGLRERGWPFGPVSLLAVAALWKSWVIPPWLADSMAEQREGLERFLELAGGPPLPGVLPRFHAPG
eukprot:10054223-Alexandrium_andersonii.AAC.1